MSKTKKLGHEIDETAIKPNKEKVKAILDLKHPENQKQFLARLSEKTERLRRLGAFSKDRETIGKTDASETGLGILLWQKQSDGEITPIAFGSRYLNDSKKNYSIRELELLAVVWGLEKFPFYLHGKKVFLNTDNQALEPLIKSNRCNRQYSARLTRLLDRLALFDIAIQHIAGSNLKFTNFLSRNPVEKAVIEDVYDEQNVSTILSEQAELNVKNRPLFVEQSQNPLERIKTTEENRNNQSHWKRTFERNRDVNKNYYEQAKSASNKRRQKAKTESSIRSLKLNSIQNSKLPKSLPLFRSEMNRHYFHWSATAKIMEMIKDKERAEKPSDL